MASAQRILRFLAGRFRDTQSDGKVYALQNGALLDVTNITQKALSTVPLSVTSAGQTQFTVPGGYTPGLLQVARNGILQSFTGTNGTSITLSSGTSSTSDTVTAYVFATFQVANALMLSGGTMAGPLVSPGIAMTGAINNAPIVTLASAATVNIAAAAANDLTITGTTTITAFDAAASGIVKRLTFSGALTLAYNSTSLILPYGASITTAPGDVATFLSLGSGNWRCVGYQRASAAMLRKDISSGSIYVSLLKSADQSIPNGVVTSVTWEVEAFDTMDVHSTTASTDQLVLPAGRYLAVSTIQFDAAAAGRRGNRLTLDGSLVQGTNILVLPATSSGSTAIQSLSIVDVSSPSQILRVGAFQDSGGSLSLQAAGCALKVIQLG